MTLIPAFEIGVWNAWIFMSSFLLQMLVVILMGRRVWARTSLPPDFKLSSWERITTIIVNVVWLLATIYSIFLPLRLGTIWFCIGLLVFLIGLLMLAVATVNFATASEKKPVTQGVYRFSRNPLYVSMIIIYIGTGIATASWVFILLGITNIFWLEPGVLSEERYCLERYGSEYQEYINRTPRWIGIPRPDPNKQT